MSASQIYYFDNNATTSVAPEVVEAMLPYLTAKWGNPSSPYRLGKALAAPLHAARESVAALVGARSRGVSHESGGDEQRAEPCT